MSRKYVQLSGRDKEVFIMSIVTTIQNLDMKIDDKYNKNSLSNSLELYHKLIDDGIMQPRGNQLNRSGIIPKVIRFNIPKK